MLLAFLLLQFVKGIASVAATNERSKQSCTPTASHDDERVVHFLERVEFVGWVFVTSVLLDLSFGVALRLESMVVCSRGAYNLLTTLVTRRRGSMGCRSSYDSTFSTLPSQYCMNNEGEHFLLLTRLVAQRTTSSCPT
eukprot:scaffold13584_cov30-Tisochrysis_lutea.AAC.4